MQNQPPRGPKKDDTSSSGEFSLESAGEMVVTHHATPPKTGADIKVRPRRPLPLVPVKPLQRKDDELDN